MALVFCQEKIKGKNFLMGMEKILKLRLDTYKEIGFQYVLGNFKKCKNLKRKVLEIEKQIKRFKKTEFEMIIKTIENKKND